jgi:hypothetical protein
MSQFDFNKIDDFDDHINKSIPNYDLLIDSIKSMSEYFYVKSASIYDLGCSIHQSGYPCIGGLVAPGGGRPD